MGGKKKYTKQTQPTENGTASKPVEEQKKFVNLLPVYTIYKQKFRRLTKEEFEKILRRGPEGKEAALELCKEFKKAKNIPEDIDFSRNVGYLNLPRMMPLIALLAERAGYKLKPSLVHKLKVSKTNERFRTKFTYLLVYGFWFLGRVISDSLSVKEQVNRGNMFNFTKGDLGYWWAGVKILDWNLYAETECIASSCVKFVIDDPPKYRFYTSRAIINMNQDPKYFLSNEDWDNYLHTIKHIDHRRAIESGPSLTSSSTSSNHDLSDLSLSNSDSDISSLSSCNISINSLVSRESID